MTRDQAINYAESMMRRCGITLADDGAEYEVRCLTGTAEATVRIIRRRAPGFSDLVSERDHEERRTDPSQVPGISSNSSTPIIEEALKE